MTYFFPANIADAVPLDLQPNMDALGRAMGNVVNVPFIWRDAMAHARLAKEREERRRNAMIPRHFGMYDRDFPGLKKE